MSQKQVRTKKSVLNSFKARSALDGCGGVRQLSFPGQRRPSPFCSAVVTCWILSAVGFPYKVRLSWFWSFVFALYGVCGCCLGAPLSYFAAALVHGVSVTGSQRLPAAIIFRSGASYPCVSGKADVEACRSRCKPCGWCRGPHWVLLGGRPKTATGWQL